jgi:hypothetical protein
VENLGNRPTPPVFRVYGMAVNPQILLLGTDYRIALTGPSRRGLSRGRRAEPVDHRQRDHPGLNFLDAANTTWFELPKGTSTVQMLAGDVRHVSARQVLYRSAYT